MAKQIKLVVVGPFPPPNSGTTIKNHELELALDHIGCSISKVDTCKARFFTLFFLLAILFRFSNEAIIASVSRRGRAILLPYALVATVVFHKRMVLLPCGGTMADELRKMRGLKRLIYHTACRKLVRIYPETAALKCRLESNVPGCRCEVMYNFKRRPDVKLGRVSGLGPLRLVFLSRLREEKGIFVLLDAVSYIMDSNKIDVSLTFYGDFLPGDDRNQELFRGRLESLSFARYGGYLEPEAVTRTISTHDVFVFPTYFETEGFPGVLVDAAYAGLPVIATRVAYNAEIIEHGANGLLCNPNDAVSLAESIIEMSLDRKKRWKMGDENWRRSSAFDSVLAARRLVTSLTEVGAR